MFNNAVYIVARAYGCLGGGCTLAVLLGLRCMRSSSYTCL